MLRLEESTIDENQASVNMDDYFSADSRLRAHSDSKTNPYDPETHSGPIYIVEFKAGRTDYFFVPEVNRSPVIKIAENDLVIVEADRGKVKIILL